MNFSVELISSCDSTNEMDLLLKRVAACEGQKKMKFTKKVLKGLGSGICIASIVASCKSKRNGRIKGRCNLRIHTPHQYERGSVERVHILWHLHTIQLFL